MNLSANNNQLFPSKYPTGSSINVDQPPVNHAAAWRNTRMLSTRLGLCPGAREYHWWHIVHRHTVCPIVRPYSIERWIHIDIHRSSFVLICVFERAITWWLDTQTPLWPNDKKYAVNLLMTPPPHGRPTYTRIALRPPWTWRPSLLQQGRR